MGTTQIIVISDNMLFSNLIRTILKGVPFTEIMSFESIENAEKAIFEDDPDFLDFL